MQRKKPAGRPQPNRNSAARRRKTPWVRRIVSSLILLLIVVAVVFGVAKAAGWVKDLLREEHARTTESATIKPVEINACSDAELDLSVTPSATTLPEGMGFDVAVKIGNKGKADCSFDMSTLDVSLQGPSGPIWTPTACAEMDQMLLLAPGKSWETALTWDGFVYSDCVLVQHDSVGATPAEGTYALKWAAPDSVTAQETQIQIY